ncbi:MAG: DNA adenine methylase [Acidimicrobiales bacterium]
MIKYLGSKRRLVPVIAAMASAVGARTALDMFTGTTRVAQAIKRTGATVTAVDAARYSEAFARCYVATDGSSTDRDELTAALEHLSHLTPVRGYVTETFCELSRFFQPFNGERIDAIRDSIEADFSHSPLYPILLTSLLEAADRVDSTTGVQMAYVKQWAPRSFRALELRVPELLDGPGTAIRADACAIAPKLGGFDFTYLDPPYNQHRYFTNYHVWETLIAWDAPEHYGVACKRQDSRSENTKSVFNSKRSMPEALAKLVGQLDCSLLVLSYNDESWLSLDELVAMCAQKDAVATLSFESARYVGARIGIHNPLGERVGVISHLRNHEYMVVAGERRCVDAAVTAASTVSPLSSRLLAKPGP